MNTPQPAPGPAQRRDWTRRLVIVLVALVVIAVAAATFVFSYDGVHAAALAGGMSAQLARYYPGLFDAVLVIACVAAMTLRDGRWWWRLWAWAVIVVVLAAIGTTDVLHATNYALRHRATEGIVAAAPAVAVLLAFSLLLTMLRQSRTRPAVEAPVITATVPIRPPATPIALPPVPVHPDAPGPGDSPVTDAAPAREEPAVDRVGGGPVLHDLAPPDPALRDPLLGDPVVGEPVVGEPVVGGPVVSSTGRDVTQEVPALTPHQVTGPSAAAAPAAPAAAPSPGGRPAPPTVPVPAPPTVQVPIAAPQTASTPEPPGIRYAGSGVSAKTGNPKAATPDMDYLDAEDPGQFAGLVYSAREERPDAGEAAGDDEAPAGPATPELDDDDAPPFATAPFARVPRLNRVRSTPTPPSKDEDEDEDQ